MPKAPLAIVSELVLVEGENLGSNLLRAVNREGNRFSFALKAGPKPLPMAPGARTAAVGNWERSNQHSQIVARSAFRQGLGKGAACLRRVLGRGTLPIVDMGHRLGLSRSSLRPRRPTKISASGPASTWWLGDR